MFDNIYIRQTLLRKTRRARKISLQRLSELTGVSYLHLQEIENLRRRATVEEARVISGALDIPVSHLGVLMSQVR